MHAAQGQKTVVASFLRTMESQSKKNSPTVKPKPAPIQAPVTTATSAGPDPLSPDSTGLVLEYPAVTAAAYTIKKGVKETPLEVSCDTTHLSHTPHTPPTYIVLYSDPLSSQTC